MKWSKLLALLLCGLLALSPAALAEDPPADDPGSGQTEPAGPEEPGEPGEPDEPGEPEEPEGLVIQLAGATEDENHIWWIAKDPAGVLEFTWAFPGADAWRVTVTAPDGTELLREEGTAAGLKLPQEGLTDGTYTLQVTALAAEEPLASASLQFALGEKKTPQRPSFRRRTGGGGLQPGQALTRTHARGTGDMSLYGIVALEVSAAPMEILTVGGTELDITCGGASFTASLRTGVLQLETEGAPDWRISQAALETLRDSGIRILALISAEGQVRLNTDLQLRGSNYTRERSAGFVASDFILTLEGRVFRVQVEDRVYQLLNHELINAG